MFEIMQSCTCCGDEHRLGGQSRSCGCEERRKKGQYCKNCEHCTKHCHCKQDVKLCVWEIFVPTMIGDNPVRTRYHRVWDNKVRGLTQGLTVYHPAKGQWIEKGELFKERMIPVRIACTEAQIEAIADLTLEYYKQKAVMYYLVTDKVFIRKVK